MLQAITYFFDILPFTFYTPVQLINLVNGFQVLTVLASCSILDVWQDSEYASALIGCF